MKSLAPHSNTYSLLTALVLLPLSGCDKEKEDSPADAASITQGQKGESSKPTSEEDASAGAASKTQDEAEAAAQGEVGGEAGADSQLSCSDMKQWQKLELKYLKDGAIHVPKEGFSLPKLEFRECSEGQHCEEAVLTDTQQLLAVGASGNKIRYLVSQDCGENVMVSVFSGDGTGVSSFLGYDMAFAEGRVGGDRILLEGFARARSEKAARGFNERDYLLTAREGKFAKIEPARNRSGYGLSAAASQIVQVELNGQKCTTLFWKLGVGECDFEGPDTEEFVLLGSNMIFQDAETKKGMAWSVKGGSRELLPQLTWVVSDGVNVVWAEEQQVFTMQSSWDLAELKSEALKGPAGPKPVAVGCGRTLARTDGGMVLRNLKKGSYWTLDAARFKKGSGHAVMTCEHVIWENGVRIALRGLGKLTEYSEPSALEAEQTELTSGQGAADTPTADEPAIAGAKTEEEPTADKAGAPAQPPEASPPTTDTSAPAPTPSR